MISFKEWQNIDLRVGLIEEVEEIEGKDKLYKMVVSFGEEKRTVVAGLKSFYEVNELKDKKAVFVYNLEPAKVAGIDSNAMILASKNSEGEYKIFFADNSVEEGSKLE